MTFASIVIALGLEYWRSFRGRPAIERGFLRYAGWLDRQLNGGAATQGALALAAALVPPVLAVAAAHYAFAAIQPSLGVLVDAAVLYLLLGMRREIRAFHEVAAALDAGDLERARRVLARFRGVAGAELDSATIARLAIEHGLIASYRRVFAMLFWFAVLPGATGAVIYRALALLAELWPALPPSAEPTPMGEAREAFGAPARRLAEWADWLPSRLTALSFAIVGDFEDAIHCWRTQAAGIARESGSASAGIVLASAAGALGIELGSATPVDGEESDANPEPELGEAAASAHFPSMDGLVLRALALWTLLILLLTIAHFAR